MGPSSLTSALVSLIADHKATEPMQVVVSAMVDFLLENFQWMSASDANQLAYAAYELA